MFRGQNIFEIIQLGGITMYVLILCSVVSVAVVIERLVYFQRRLNVSRVSLMEQIRRELVKGHAPAVGVCRNIDTPCSKVAMAGLSHHGQDSQNISNAMEREITIESIKLERFISIVGTIGGTAVYIGLFGTVLGIMRAFNDIGKVSSGGMDVVTHGIAEALVCTAAGLLVAIPAVVSYNFLMRKIDTITVDMQLTASELLDLMGEKKK